MWRMAISTMPFPTLLKTSREGAGLSQRRVAIFVDVTEKTVRSWESGEAEPRLGHLTKLAELFGWPLPFAKGRYPGLRRRTVAA